MEARRAPTSRPILTTRALAAAGSLCQERGAQLTAIRRAALQALWQAKQPIGAYELLSRLEVVLRRTLTPPTVYRALDFLLQQGLVSRIESRNAYVPCAHPDRPHACVFFVCDQCSTSVEIENAALEKLIAHEATSLGFKIVRRVIELQGLCENCRSSGEKAEQPNG